MTTRVDDLRVLAVDDPNMPRSLKRRLWTDRSSTGKFWIAVSPALALYLVFTVYPMIQVVVASFTDARGFNRPWEFIGLDNFVRISRAIRC